MRSVTQGDVIRADAKEIPRIFQILYAGEGESRKPEDNATPPVLADTDKGDKSVTVVIKGHELVAISFHMPTSCDLCTKQLWAPFRPPPAVECRRKLINSSYFIAFEIRRNISIVSYSRTGRRGAVEESYLHHPALELLLGHRSDHWRLWKTLTPSSDQYGALTILPIALPTAILLLFICHVQLDLRSAILSCILRLLSGRPQLSPDSLQIY